MATAKFPGALVADTDLPNVGDGIDQSTKLNGSLTSVATTITVDSTANFASSGFIIIGSEIITYTGKTATDFTGCTRGAHGTSAAAHSDNADVICGPSGRFWDQIVEELKAIEAELGTDPAGVSATVKARFGSFDNDSFSGDVAFGGNDITDLGNVTFKTGATGGTLRTGTSATDKFVLQAYDTNLASYTTVLQVNAGNAVDSTLSGGWTIESPTLTGDTTISGDLVVSGTGPHAIGGVAVTGHPLTVYNGNPSNSNEGITIRSDNASSWGGALNYWTEIGTTGTFGVTGRINVEGSGSGNFMRFFTHNGTTLEERLRITESGDLVFKNDSNNAFFKTIGSYVFQVDTDNNAVESWLFRNGAGTDVVTISEAGQITMPSGQKLYLDGGGDTYIHENIANQVQIVAGGSARFEITASGNAYVYNSLFVAGHGTTASAANAFLDSADSGKLLRSTSSIRYKHDIDDYGLSRAYETISSLRPITYRGKEDEDQRRYLGFIAEEVAAIEPLLATYDEGGESGTPNYVTYGRITAPLVAVVQDLLARVAALEEK